MGLSGFKSQITEGCSFMFRPSYLNEHLASNKNVSRCWKMLVWYNLEKQGMKIQMQSYTTCVKRYVNMELLCKKEKSLVLISKWGYEVYFLPYTSLFFPNDNENDRKTYKWMQPQKQVQTVISWITPPAPPVSCIKVLIPTTSEYDLTWR